MCNTHKHLGSRTDNEIVVPTSAKGTLAQKSERSDPRIEDHSSRALPDRSAKTRSDIADSLGDSDGMEQVAESATPQIERIEQVSSETKPTAPSTPKPEPRSDHGTGSGKKSDPRGNDQKPSSQRSGKTPQGGRSAAAKVEPPKPAASAPAVTADLPAQKPTVPYVAATAAPIAIPAKAAKAETPKPAATEKKELGAEEFRKIRSAIETGLSNYRGIAPFKTKNRKSERDRTLNAIFSVAGENPTGDSNRFLAAKRLAKLVGGDCLKMVEDLHKN